MAFASLDMHQVSWSPLWIPKLWQRHLWPWIEGKWLLLRSNMDKGNPVCPSYWHQTSILIFKTLNIIEILQYLLTCLFFYLLFNMFINIYKERERERLVKVTLLFVTPMDYTVYGILQARILEGVVFLFSRASSQPKDQTQVSHIAGRFFTRGATGKPRNTGVGSLSLLQWIFLTQELNHGFLP